MNKKLLSSFFTAFIIFYLAIFVFGVFVYKSGKSYYKTHTASQFENDQYLSQTFNKRDQNFLANSSSEVQAAGVIDTAIAAYKAVKIYTDISNDAPGFVKTQFTGFMDDTVHTALVGCSLNDFNAALEEANTAEELKNSEKCSGITTSLFNNVGAEEIEASRPSGGILALYSQSTEELGNIETKMFNDSLYAQHILNQVPIVGNATSSRVFAAAGDTRLSEYALDDVFFGIWKTNLNLTYLLIIIPTVAFGFAIMFRMQLGPQTQVTLMKAIPRILITILLITFSFPIASIMLRLGKILSDIAIGLVWTLSTELPSGSFQLDQLTFMNSVVGTVLEAVGYFVLIICAVIVLIVTLFRMVFAYFGQLIKVSFLIAFSPIILLFSAFPGREGVMANYFKTLAANIMGYFAIFILFHLSWATLKLGDTFFFNSPFLLPLMFQAAAITILWKAPSAPKLIKEMIGVEPLFGGGDPKKR